MSTPLQSQPPPSQAPFSAHHGHPALSPASAQGSHSRPSAPFGFLISLSRFHPSVSCTKSASLVGPPASFSSLSAQGFAPTPSPRTPLLRAHSSVRPSAGHGAHTRPGTAHTSHLHSSPPGPPEPRPPHPTPMQIHCRGPEKGQSLGQVSSAPSPISPAGDPSDRFSYSCQRLLAPSIPSGRPPSRPQTTCFRPRFLRPLGPPLAGVPFLMMMSPRPGRLQTRALPPSQSVSPQTVLTQPGSLGPQIVSPLLS